MKGLRNAALRETGVLSAGVGWKAEAVFGLPGPELLG